MSSWNEIARPVHDDPPHYCGHCLAPVRARARVCPRCDWSFEGSGRFDRLGGVPPSSRALDLALRVGPSGLLPSTA